MCNKSNISSCMLYVQIISCYRIYIYLNKEIYPIPQMSKLFVYRRRTDNTMAKRKKYKRTNNDLQNITHKTKDQVTRTPLKCVFVITFFII